MTLRCMKCGSKNLVYAGTTGAYAAFHTMGVYLCKDCGHVGTAVEEGKGDERVLEE